MRSPREIVFRYAPCMYAAAFVVLGLGACEPLPPTETGVLTVVKEQTSAWVRNFNPLTTNPRFPTQAGIYEPLFIYNPLRGEWVPWLGTAYAWRTNQVLEITIRNGVRWSDGHPMDASDVAFTFNLFLNEPALDLGGLRAFVDRVVAEDADTFVVYLQRPYGPGFESVARTLIVPEHVLTKVDDLLRWTNPEPVGTGPFTEVRLFRSQVYEIERNPHYWQGVAAVEALRFPAIGSNDQLAMALIQGEVDWAGAFVPEIDRIYVARDPAHHKYWHPLGPSWFVYANTQRPPFNDVRVRKAMSMALNRELMLEVSNWAAFADPDPGTGLSDYYAAWRSAEVEQTVDWMAYDPTGAEALLDEVGMRRGDDGLRRLPNGEPFSADFTMVSGWSDTVRASQIAVTNLRAVGLDIRARSIESGAWFGNTFAGQFDITTGWSTSSTSPYLFYRDLMSPTTVFPEGNANAVNWHRYGSPMADEVLRRFEQTTDVETQRTLSVDLQRQFTTEIPAIPLYGGPVWGEFNTTRFVGWPTRDDPYAMPSPNPPFTPLLVLTRIRPRRSAL